MQSCGGLDGKRNALLPSINLLCGQTSLVTTRDWAIATCPFIDQKKAVHFLSTGQTNEVERSVGCNAGLPTLSCIYNRSAPTYSHSVHGTASPFEVVARKPFAQSRLSRRRAAARLQLVGVRACVPACQSAWTSPTRETCVGDRSRAI